MTPCSYTNPYKCFQGVVGSQIRFKNGYVDGWMGGYVDRWISGYVDKSMGGSVD